MYPFFRFFASLYSSQGSFWATPADSYTTESTDYASFDADYYTYEYDTFDDKTNSPKLFHMSIDEYGYDTVYLYKKHVMKFS